MALAGTHATGYSNQYRTCATVWRMCCARVIAESAESDAERCAQYRDDPVGFFRDILKIEPWSRQRELLEMVRDFRRVSCVSGHKVGKSFGVGGLALWLYCSYPGARVIFTGPSENNVDTIIWNAIKRLVARARMFGTIIPGTEDMSKSARVGIQNARTFAEVRGIVAAKPESLSGIAGECVFLLVDEASGVKEENYESLLSNIAAEGSKLVMIGNPTRADGTFYESHHSRQWTESNRIGYHTMTISTEESPNVTGEWQENRECKLIDGKAVWCDRTRPMPGLGGQDYIDQVRADYGDDTPQFHIRITGSFKAAEELKLHSSARLQASSDRWPDTPAEGRLHIGIDPAGPGEGGDNSAFCVRKGLRILEVYESNALSPEAIYVHAMGLIKEHQPAKGPAPVIALDREGPVGWDTLKIFREHEVKEGYILIPVRASDKAIRQPTLYHLTRDELWVSGRDWVLAGGAIPNHGELKRQLHVAELEARKGGYYGQVKVTAKDKMKEQIGRSPDLADAFNLACWEPGWLRGKDADAVQVQPRPEQADVLSSQFDDQGPGGALDPFGGIGGGSGGFGMGGGGLGP